MAEKERYEGGMEWKQGRSGQKGGEEQKKEGVEGRKERKEGRSGRKERKGNYLAEGHLYHSPLGQCLRG